MSLANNLLRNLSASQVDEQDDTLIIDHYTRTIIIPKHITNLGVEKDDDVLRLNFRMPRKLGEVDLSTFGIRINYINAAGESDAYDASDAEVVGDNLTFSWQVGPLAVAYRGDTQFNVCMIKLKENGEVDREYHTTVASLPVLEGLEVDETLIKPYSDLIEQWRNALFGVGDTEEQRIKDVSAIEQENIRQTADYIADTIPKDYQTTFKMIDNADRTKSDAIISTSEGEVITVADSSDDYLRGLRVFGKTTQVTTTGKNLLNNTAQTSTINGITYVVKSDGSVHANGAATDDSFLTIGSVSYAGGVEYKISGCPVGGTMNTYTLYAVYGDGLYAFDTGNSQTFTPEQDMVKNVSIKITKGVTVSNLVFYPMVRVSANNDSAYEPYSGGFESPSPDWPQPLNSYDVNFGLFGGNIVDANSLDTYANTSLNVTENGYSIVVKGGSTGGWTSSVYELPAAATHLLRGRKVYLSHDSFISEQSVGARAGFNITRENGVTDYPASIGPTYQTVSITIPTDAKKIIFAIYSNNSGQILTTDNTVSIKGLRVSVSEQCEWVPYSEIQLQSHLALPAVPVNIDGDYTDANGRQWIGDEIDYERGVRIQRIKQLTLTGNEQIVNVTGDYAIPLNTSIYAYDYADRVQCLCNYYPGVSRHDIAQLIKTSGSLGISANINYIRIADTLHYPTADVDAFRQFITDRYNAGDPVIVSYILATPIEQTLGPDEIEWFKFAHTNFPNTTVLNDAGATMQLKYNVDTKTYLDNCFRPTDEQVQSSVDAWLSTHYINAEEAKF